MPAMRKHIYDLDTPHGPVQVTLYRDLSEAFVIFSGPYAYNTVDLLATRVRATFLQHLAPENICWVVRQTTRRGTDIIRQVDMRCQDDRHTHPLARTRTRDELEEVLREIDAAHPENPDHDHYLASGGT